MTILLTGATGLLGSEFAARLGVDAVTVPRAALDVRNPSAFFENVGSAKPDIVLNCAAHVDAEAAESEPDPAYSANAIMPGLLASACRRVGALLVHFSSTGCYGAWKSTPYTEEDATQPTTVHHRSKVSGEIAVRNSGCEHLILRTGWLFGGGSQHKKNFVWQRIVEGMGSKQVRSDTEQFGNPTYAGDVVSQTLELVRLRLTGTYNCVSRGTASRYDYVSRIVDAADLGCEMVPSRAFKRAAPVSPNEMAVNYRLGLMGLDQMPEWTTSLDAYVARIQDWPQWGALTRQSEAHEQRL